jgi:chitinase
MMNKRILHSMRAAISVMLLAFPAMAPAQNDLWATAYYAGWQQGWYNNGTLPAQEIDYTALTHIVHFSLVPNSNGTLDADPNGITHVNSTELVSRAHAAGKKVIISVGGWMSDVGFRGATSAANRALFITNLIDFITTRGYDGIDIDWEILQSSDAVQYAVFITALRTALNAIQPRPLLTAAVGGEAEILAQVHTLFDQINIMTYDFSGAWPGWVTWHNSPIYDGGFRFPSTNGPVPSADRTVDAFLAAGVPAHKLGIGIDFYGYVWNGGSGTPMGGATDPRQSWSGAPWVQGNVPYSAIMRDYYQPALYRWDEAAQAAYLCIDLPGSANDRFVSYDNEMSVQKKFEYVRSKGIGGVIIWELGGGYRTDQPAGRRDLLLQEVKRNLDGTSGTGTDPGVPTEFRLEQNFPNPFNPATEIKFHVPVRANITLRIFNLLGESVATLVNESMEPGSYASHWMADRVASGAYLYRIEARTAEGDYIVQTKKMIVLK